MAVTEFALATQPLGADPLTGNLFSSGVEVALIVGDPSILNTTDTTWYAWLRDLGHRVTFMDDSDAENQSFDLIAVSESVDPATVTTKWFPDAVGNPPVILGDQSLWDDWGAKATAGDASSQSATQVDYVDNAHVQWTGESNPIATVTVYSTSSTLSYIANANLSVDVEPICENTANTGCVVGWLPSGSSTDTPAASTNHVVQWGLCGTSGTPTGNANTAHEQLFKDVVKRLLSLPTLPPIYTPRALRANLLR